MMSFTAIALALQCFIIIGSVSIVVLPPGECLRKVYQVVWKLKLVTESNNLAGVSPDV